MYLSEQSNNEEQNNKPPDLFHQDTLKLKKMAQRILEDMFVEVKTKRQVKLILFQTHIIKQQENKLYRVQIDNTLSFSINRQKLEIQFGRQDETLQICLIEKFSTIDTKKFQQWVQQLKSIISQRNFHQKYQICETIGSGKNSNVVKVIQKQTGIQFAAKITNMSHKVLEQIKILRILDHPNLIHFKEFYIQKQATYIIMDYENGGNILGIIKNKEALPPKERIKIFNDILNGLEYLRLKQIVHRDLKPQNILYSSKDNNYKIADFGLAIFNNTQYQNIVGTPGYIAPELFASKKQQRLSNIKADIYSAGIIFYELITKQPFYKGLTSHQVLKNNIHGKATKLIKHENILQIEKKLLKMMLKRCEKKRKNSYDIMKSSVFNKLTHMYVFTSSKSFSQSLTKTNNSESQDDEISIFNTVKQLLRFRSQSTY